MVATTSAQVSVKPGECSACVMGLAARCAPLGAGSAPAKKGMLKQTRSATGQPI
jgi:hypothetical protein